MPPPLRRALSARLRRGLSTAASRPPWAMIYHTMLARSPEQRASLQLAKPPCASHLVVPSHLVDPRPRPDPGDDAMGSLAGVVRAASGDGLLLLDFIDGPAAAPFVGKHGAAPARQSTGIDMDHDITRFVCNPLSGQMFCLPDIEGTKKTATCQSLGLLTRSEGLHMPPDGYAVAELSEDHEEEERSFVMRRFLSQTGRWEKVVGLPSPLPLARRLDIDHEVLAFAGRLWWVDVSWGAVSADPFSDRPDLRFVELPSGSVMEPGEELRVLGRYRRMGFSEGKLRYAELSRKEPYLISSFVLNNGGCWTLEYRVALSRLWKNIGRPCQDKVWIGAIDPLIASVVYFKIDSFVLAIDMGREEVFECSRIDEGAGPSSFFSGFFKPCVLPWWLEASRIPYTGTLFSNKENVKNKTLADILVRCRQ